MKLRKPSASSAPKTPFTKPVTEWHAEKRGGVWYVESKEFQQWVSEAHKLEEQIESLSEARNEALHRIREMTVNVKENPDDDVDMSGHGFDVKVKRRNQFRWDSVKLEEIFAQSSNLPTHVKKNLSVDRRTFETGLTASEQDELRPALNVVSQKSAVTITRSR
jgi:hypothetical protein